MRSPMTPGALAEGGAWEGSKDRFAELLSIWQRPWGEDDTDACLAFALVCRDADPDDIIASAPPRVAAVEPRFLKPLTKWLGRGLWKNQPPAAEAEARQRQGIAGRNDAQAGRTIMSKVVPIHRAQLGRLKMLNELAADADRVVRRHDEIENLVVIVRKMEAMRRGEQLDRLIADTRRKAMLDQHDEALVARCIEALKLLDANENYDDDDPEECGLRRSRSSARGSRFWPVRFRTATASAIRKSTRERCSKTSSRSKA
ncbi:MAG: hypothetical protein WDN50_02450 [Bradyrhizobium sp.]